MLLTPELCCAARALLRWSPQQLALAADLELATVEVFEADGLVPPETVDAMLDALAGAGLDFIPAGGSSLDGGPGVRTIPEPEPEVAAAEESEELEERMLEEAEEFSAQDITDV